MAFDLHSNRSKYFKIQWQNSEETIIPLVEQFKEITPETKVFEIGCRDRGVLMPFYERDCFITGLNLFFLHNSSTTSIISFINCLVSIKFPLSSLSSEEFLNRIISLITVWLHGYFSRYPRKEKIEACTVILPLFNRENNS